MTGTPKIPWRSVSGALLVAASLAASMPGRADGSGMFCGGPAKGGDPSDLANVVGDQTLEYIAQQPASMFVCGKGYLFEKCGDHETAHKIFDRCIAAGYPGAMIWKALLLEDGAGVEPDLAKAAELMHRAATSGDPAYAPIGKMHYATMLHQGKGVARDEAAARQWFEAAAAEGSEEAREFLRTGYHTGARDRSGMGSGTPTPGALTRGLTGDNASISPQQVAALDATVNRKNPSISKMLPPDASIRNAPPAAPPVEQDATPSEPVVQKLRAVVPVIAPSTNATTPWLVLLLALAIAAGVLRQRLRTLNHTASDKA